MTTLTVDTPVTLKKTHFRNPAELVYFFAGLQLQLQKKQSKKKSQYQIAKEDLAMGRNIISLDDYMLQR